MYSSWYPLKFKSHREITGILNKYLTFFFFLFPLKFEIDIELVRNLLKGT